MNEKYLGAAILLLTFSVLFWQSSLFFNSRIKNPELKYRLKDALLHPEDFNLASFLSYESAKICNKALKQIKKELIGEALKRTNGNQSLAACMLGISRQALSKRLCRNQLMN